MNKTIRIIVIALAVICSITLITASLFIYAANENNRKELQTYFVKRDKLLTSGQQLQNLVGQLNDTLTSEQKRQIAINELAVTQSKVTIKTPIVQQVPEPVVQVTPQPIIQPTPPVVVVPIKRRTRAS